MPGPAPRPNALRPNQGAAFVRLPSEGRTKEAPPWPYPTEPDADLLERWVYLWKLPQAIAWEKIQMYRVVARYCMILCYAETSALPAMQTSAVQLEDRLGLNPMSMLRLRWTVAEDELAEKRDEKVVVESARTRFRAVEKDQKSA